MKITKYIYIKWIFTACISIFLFTGNSIYSTVLKAEILQDINKLSWRDSDFKVKISNLKSIIKDQIEDNEVQNELISSLIKKCEKEEKKLMRQIRREENAHHKRNVYF